MLLIPQRYEFSSKSQLRGKVTSKGIGCCWYHKGTNFQANHNRTCLKSLSWQVVADTTKVRIFKQITTERRTGMFRIGLLLIPQRYEFSSKSQHICCVVSKYLRCCWYHKGTNFQANHNVSSAQLQLLSVVADTTKVRIFKQITTEIKENDFQKALLLIPQRYEFSSKSQLYLGVDVKVKVVADTTKVRIFKQITT